MKVNFKQPILDLDGQPMRASKKIGGETKEVDLTVEDAVVQALTTLQGAVGSEENFSRYMIAKTIKEGGEIKVEDAAIIKEAATKIWQPVVFGRICDALEGADQPVN